MIWRTLELAFARFQAKGCAQALAIVFDRTAPELLRVARHCSASAADAEDLVQATFLVAIESASSHEAGRPVLPWLLGILANQARCARRAARRRPDPARLRPDVVVDVHGEVAIGELQRELAAAITRLPEVYRPVLRLWFEHGLEAQEIALALERPAGTVRAQVSRGIELLRRFLPASLAGGAAITAVTGRGLAAVRQHVLGAVPGTSSSLASLLVFGGLLMLHHKILAAAAALLLGLFSWFLIDGATVPAAPKPAEAPVATGTAVTADGPVGDSTASELQRDPVAATTPAIADRESGARATTTGELIVRLRAAKDQSPLAGFGVAVRAAADLQNLALTSVFRASDARGVVHFPGLAAQQWFVELDRLGAVAAVDVAAGAVVEHVVDVPDGVIVVGTVVDGRGQPVLGADLVVQGSALAAPRVGRSDALGRFEVTHLQRVELQAKKAGWTPSRSRFVDGRPGDRIEFVLQLGDAGRRLGGRVLDDRGVPLAGCVVAVLPEHARQVTPWDREKPQLRPLWLHTDGDGRFATDEVGSDRYLVVARPSNLDTPPAWGEADTMHGDAFVELRSAAPTVIEGRVSRAGAPVAGVQVIAWPEKCAAEIGYLLNLIGMRTGTTGADGTFRIVGTLPGELVLQAMQGMEKVGDARRTLAAGETTRWDLDVADGAALRIRITGVQPLPAGLIALVYPKGVANQAPAMVPVGTDGTASYSGPRAAGVDVVLAQFPGGRSIVQLARRADVGADAPEVVIALRAEDLPKSRVRGRLVDPLGAPVAATNVVVQRVDAEGLAVVLEAPTGADGTFSVGPLPAGDYLVRVGELATARFVGKVVVTTARDEDAGELIVPAK